MNINNEIQNKIDLTYLLKKNLDDLTYEDVEKFIEQKVSEGMQLDYKQDVSHGLSSDFAAFSNTRGGVIIIGIEEDKSIPKNIIPVSSNLGEQIDQLAANVTPLPIYEKHFINAQNHGNVGIWIIRIIEGNEPPHYINNKGRILVRVDQINKDMNNEFIAEASPQVLRSFFDKRENAKMRRENNITRVNQQFEGYVKQLESKYLNDINLLTDTFFEVTFQPQNPGSELMEYNNILGIIKTFNIDLLNAPITIPGGVLYSRNISSLGCKVLQITDEGVCSFKSNILSHSKKDPIEIGRIFKELFKLLDNYNKLLTEIRYYGTINIKIGLTNLLGKEVIGIEPYYESVQKCILKEYSKEYNYDNIHFDGEKLKTKILDDTLWSFGFSYTKKFFYKDLL